MTDGDRLAVYRAKHRFVVQGHRARRLHYDLILLARLYRTALDHLGTGDPLRPLIGLDQRLADIEPHV